MKRKTKFFFFFGIIFFILTLAQPQCDQSLIDNPVLKMCQNCSLVTNQDNCQNNCQKGQVYQQQSGCLTYCGNLKVAQDQANCDDTIYSCIDGYYWSTIENKCIQQQFYCKTQIYDQHYQISINENCVFVEVSHNFSSCQGFQYQSMLLGQCKKYCGNGQISNLYQSCKSSKLCVDGFAMSYAGNYCKRCEGYSDQDFQIYFCNDCSLSSNVQTCFAQPYYSSQLQKCVNYCGLGQIDDQGNCQTSKLCIDTFVWNIITQKCEQAQKIQCSQSFNYDGYNIIKCLNCALASELQFSFNRQYVLPLIQMVSIQKDAQIVVWYLMLNIQQAKCTNNPQGICPALKNNDQYVLQCPNCSLVSNQLPQPNNQCQNICLNSQLPFWDQKQNKCLFYCGNGLIAQAQEYCQSSNICIDGFIYNNKGGCTPLSQNNQNISTTSTVDNGLLVTIIPICVDSLLIILFIIFVFYVIKKLKPVIEKINAVSTQYQSIQQQQQESEKLITKYQQELANANANKKGETNKNDTDVNKIRKSQDLEEQSLSQQTIHKFMKVNNSYEQLPQGSQQQIQQTPQIEIQIDQ
ncbi:hypothetical protein ABPG74_021107 [Tetrahymena malaccensis]